jgi:hypothetical protein
VSLTLVSEAGAAPDTSGETFGEAKVALSEAGYTPVVSTSVGDKTIAPSSAKKPPLPMGTRRTPQSRRCSCR